MKRKLLIILLSAVVATGISVFAVACTTGGGITYEPGDSVVDGGEVEYIEQDSNGNWIRYTGTKYEVTYLLENDSLIELEGEKPEELIITGYSGDVVELSLADIENSVRIDDSPVSVAGIGDRAFYGCDTLTTADLTKVNASLEFTIGTNAFGGCSALEEVTFPASESVYTNGNEIESGAFNSATALTSVTITDRFASIGDSAFASCTSLESVTIPARVATIGEAAFYGTVSLANFVIPEGSRLRSIGNSAFNSSGITSFDFSKAPITYVGGYAFQDSALTTVSVPGTVTYIGQGAFAYCDDLAYASIPYAGNSAAQASSVANIFGNDTESKTDMELVITAATSISDGAFRGCSYLESITISAATPGLFTIYGSDGATVDRVFELAADDIVFSVSSSMFENCSALTRVSLPTMTGNIGSRAFYNCLSLSSVRLTLEPETSLVTGLAEPLQIGSYAFYGCEALETLSVTGLENAASIGEHAFENCALLPDDILAEFESVETIGAYAFAGCEAFTEVVMPESVTTAGNYIFYNCPDIQSIEIGTFSVYEYSSSSGYEYSNVYGSYLSSLFGTDEYIGSYSDYYQAYSGALPVSLTTVTLGDVCSLPASYFRDASHITAVTLGFVTSSSATPSIGSYAFEGCTSLNDSVLDTVGGVQSIGNRAFAECEAFTEAVIPDSVTSLGNNIFYDCPNIQSLTVEEYSVYNNYSYSNLFTYVSDLFGASGQGNSSYDSSSGGYVYEFYNAYNGYVPTALTSVTFGNVESVPDNAFRGMTELTDVSLEFFNAYSTTQSIGNYAFYGCENLDTFTVTGGEYVDEIGDYAFSGCTLLPDDIFDYFTSITSIGDRAFEGCEAFTDVTIPDSVTSLGNNIFYDCPNIQSLTVEEYSVYNNYSYSNLFTYVSDLFGASGQGNSSYDSSSGGYVYEFYNAYNGYVPTALTSVTFGNVESVPDNAFRGMTELTDVSLEFFNAYSTTQSIGNYAFYGCENLDTFTVTGGEYVDEIGDYAFSGCTLLPDDIFDYFTSITSIGDRAFEGCEAFADVTIPDSVTSLGSNIFYDCPNIQSLTVESYSYGSSTNNVTTIYSLFGATSQGDYVYDTDGNHYEFYYAYNGYVPTALTTVTLGNVYRLANSAFRGMTELTDVTVNFVDAYSSSSSYPYPYIGTYAFYECENLETLTLNSENGLYGVGTYAFAYCSSLTEIELPIHSGFEASNSTSTSYNLPTNVFTGCTALAEVTMGAPGSIYSGSTYYMQNLLPDTVTTVNLKYYGTLESGTYNIVDNLFYNCSNITEINFTGSEVNEIGSNAFYGCTLTNTTTVDGNVILNGWVIGTDTASKTTLTLPEAVVGIAEGVFTGTITAVNFAGEETAWNSVIKNAVSFDANCTYTYNYVISETPAA